MDLQSLGYSEDLSDSRKENNIEVFEVGREAERFQTSVAKKRRKGKALG